MAGKLTDILVFHGLVDFCKRIGWEDETEIEARRLPQNRRYGKPGVQICYNYM